MLDTISAVGGVAFLVGLFSGFSVGFCWAGELIKRSLRQARAEAERLRVLAEVEKIRRREAYGDRIPLGRGDQDGEGDGVRQGVRGGHAGGSLGR